MSGSSSSHGWTERVTRTAYMVTNSLYTVTNSPNTKTSCSLVKSQDRLQKTRVWHKYTENVLKPPLLKQHYYTCNKALGNYGAFHIRSLRVGAIRQLVEPLMYVCCMLLLHPGLFISSCLPSAHFIIGVDTALGMGLVEFGSVLRFHAVWHGCGHPSTCKLETCGHF